MQRREALEADIARVERAMDAVEPDKLANLVREHRILLAELDSLPNRAEVSNADELRQRRAARRAGASGSSRSSRSG